MAAFDDVTYVVISGMPGQLTKAHLHAIGHKQNGIHRGIGNQSNAQPHLQTGIRPIRITTYTDDEQTIIDTVADAWLMRVASASVDWQTDDDARDGIAPVMAEYLNVPESIFRNLNIITAIHARAGALQFLAANPEWDGE
jgi:hypothetical protein